MIQIEGTSPLNDDIPKNENENKPPLSDVSNQVETLLGQQSLTTNDNQTEDSNTQQNTETISPRAENEVSLQENESEQNKNEAENNNDEKKIEPENDNDENKKDEDDEEKSKNDESNNNNNEKKTEDTNENNDGKLESTNETNNEIDERKDEKKTENTNENNEEILESTNDNKNNDTGKNENKTEDENENTDLKVEIKTEDVTDDNNENKDETNEDENQQSTDKDQDLLTDQSNIKTDRSTNSNSSLTKQFSNKPISFYLNQVDPKEVEDALESLISHQTQPVEQLRDPVMQLINRKKLDALIERDYDLAEKYDQTSEILQKSGDDLLFERSERIRKLTIDDRSESITEKKSKIQEKYNTKIEELKTERRTALENLQTQQENENAAFRSKWQDPNFISKYKHPSPELIQLRFIEKKLALSKFYDEAKEKKIWADKQQKIEEKQTQIVIEEEMKKDFFRMKDAQLFQIKKITEYYDSQIKSVEFQRNKEIQAMDYALKQMEVKKNTIPNRKLHTIPKELTMMNDKITDTSSTAKMSPRTMSKLAKFRVEKKGKISVCPISESTFSKLIAAHPIVRPPSKFKVNNHPPSRLKRL